MLYAAHRRARAFVPANATPHTRAPIDARTRALMLLLLLSVAARGDCRHHHL
jgi:hypothetical protein